MKNVKLKTLTPKNFEDIIDIQKNDGFRHAYYLDKKRLERLMQRGEIFYGVYSDNSLVGFASMDVEIRAKLHFLSIDKKHQKKGYGTYLLKKIIEELKSKKTKQLYFYIEDDSPHKAFLEKQGFKKVGSYRNRFNENRDAEIFELAIN